MLARFLGTREKKPSLSERFAATFRANKKILFLDDNGGLVDMLAMDATDNYRVEFEKAATVARAMEIIEQGEIDGAILDCRLTNGNGPQVYRTLIERWPALPVVFLTVYGSNYEQEIRKIGPASIMDKNLVHDPAYMAGVFAQLGISKRSPAQVAALKSRLA